jgi:hypothetical protein
MTRRGVFARLGAALAGAVGLRAQVPQSSENVLGTAWSERKPNNGQCPVCGVQAEPWKRRPIEFSERLIRCARCSNAFFQDAEGRR